MHRWTCLSILLAVLGCAGSTPSSTNNVAPQGTAIRPVRSLRIVPRAPAACPGEVIGADYTGQLADGSTVTLTRGEVASLVRSGSAVDPRNDGGWQAYGDPLASAYSGFRLRASLPTDSSIKADTVVKPLYSCPKLTPGIFVGGDQFRVTHVRLGLLRSPFYDSIVVASVEITDGGAQRMVLGPSEMRPGAIKVGAQGRAGRAGREGRKGTDGGPCENGGRGEDGDDGLPGGPGGEVDVIVQTEAPWLADLVSVSNGGGAGGAGGRAGQGGYAGASRPASPGTTACSTSPGRMGSTGRQGPPGSPGPTPKTTSVLFSLLWPGSPLWNDVTARAVLEQLMEYSRR